MANTKGLLVWVYRWNEGDCTANGISSKYNKLILIGPGIPEIFEPNEETPAVYLAENVKGHLCVYPVSTIKRHSFDISDPRKPVYDDSPSDGKWYMFGGNFVYSSDSRFPSKYPIGIHDRCEG